MTCGNNLSYGSIENNEVRTNCENLEVEETKNEEQSNETDEHSPQPEIHRSQRSRRSQILGKMRPSLDCLEKPESMSQVPI